MAIEVSRSDISGDYLYELESETRYLKVPVAPYIELLGITPLPSQIAIMNAVNSPKYL